MLEALAILVTFFSGAGLALWLAQCTQGVAPTTAPVAAPPIAARAGRGVDVSADERGRLVLTIAAAERFASFRPPPIDAEYVVDRVRSAPLALTHARRLDRYG